MIKENNLQNLSLYKTPPNFRGKSKIVVQLWWFVQALFFNCSPQAMYGWRRFLLRIFGARIGKGVVIRPSVKITYPWKLVIEDYSWIGDDVVLYTLGSITIGKHSVVSQRSYLCTGSHDYNRIDFPIYQKPIVVESECWIATDVYVGPGVTIGHGSIVGARSSVFKNIPERKICYGNPARVIKKRKDEV